MNHDLRTSRHSFARLLTARVCGLSLLVCALGLVAVIVSAISPVDDSVQQDFAHHMRIVRGIGKTSKLAKPTLPHLNVAITSGDPARGISVDAVLDLLPRVGPPHMWH